MNKQNFKNGNSMFPLSTDALEFMQEQTLLVARLTELAGSRVIITQPTSGKVGLCVFDGELLPLTGNTSAPRIAITEILESITAHGTTYENVRIKREAVYGTSGESVSTFVVLDNMVTLKTAIANLTSDLETEKIARELYDVPKGTIIDWYGKMVVSNLPNGYLPCGKIKVASMDQVHTEEELWRKKVPGKIEFEESNDGVSYFCYRVKTYDGDIIPDLTDRFIVQAGHTYAIGATGGKNAVQLEADESGLPAHSHSFSKGIRENSQRGSTGSASLYSTFSEGGNLTIKDCTATKAAKSHENRPPFFALYKLIKVI